tara:strand:- start:13480 stop:13686 length:207 start_codon:yes stop_codon:yes gene_type:complete
MKEYSRGEEKNMSMPYNPLSERELEAVIQREEAELAEFDWFGSELIDPRKEGWDGDSFGMYKRRGRKR